MQISLPNKFNTYIEHNYISQGSNNAYKCQLE